MKKSEKKFNKIQYIDEWKKENRDRIVIEVPKGEKDILRQEATAQGKSLQQFIRDSVAYYREALK